MSTTSVQQSVNLPALPRDVLQSIFSYLDRESLSAAERVCKIWNKDDGNIRVYDFTSKSEEKSKK